MAVRGRGGQGDIRVCVMGEEEFSFCFSSIFGLFNNYIDIRLINRRKKFNYICTGAS